MDKNLILYFPFDDPGDVAYDFSQNRNDGQLESGAELTKDSVQGKALALNLTGECQTAQAIPLSGDFTLSCYVKAKTDMFWLLNFSGMEKYLQGVIPMDLAGEKGYIQLSIIKRESTFYVYANDSLLDKYTLPGTPIGFSLNDYNVDGSEAQIDELKIWNKAINISELALITANSDVEYYINGINFKDLSVFVSSSSGLVGRLARKAGLEIDWADYHGKVRDKSRPRYKERTITLKCFIEARGRSEYVQKVNAFFDQFDGSGTKRFKCEYDGTAKPLVYEVYMEDEADPDKKWGQYNKELMVGTFTIKLVEDEPVKRVLRHVSAANNSEASITFSSYRMVDVFWGDGTYTVNVSGTAVNLKHTYADPGEYEIILAGVVELIDDFSTTEIVLWDNLH
jgi:hypothetical protein